MTEVKVPSLPSVLSSSFVLTDHSQLSIWNTISKGESSFWSTCTQTYDEETKQLGYAKYMGLEFYAKSLIDAKDKKILDIGGGPVSLLLKCRNLLYGKVIDPIEYPVWVQLRYKEAKIDYLRAKAEDVVNEKGYDEVWVYNTLQHVIDPSKVLQNSINSVEKGGILRIFDWIDVFPYRLHPHMLTEDFFSTVISEYSEDKGETKIFYGEDELYGRAFYGSFRIKN